MPSREGENGFVPGRLCFVGGVGTKQSYFALWEYRLAWPRGAVTKSSRLLFQLGRG
jgi:hypothetical protein